MNGPRLLLVQCNKGHWFWAYVLEAWVDGIGWVDYRNAQAALCPNHELL